MGEEARLSCCKIIDVGLGLPRPNDVPGLQRVDVRDAYRKKILPHLVEFDPDMIFISAGFDGHKRDGMNFGYVGMIEDDYEWVTEQLVKVANSCCQGRIVSVLEGGYKIHGGIVSPFARSVASHVRALVEGGSSRELYSKEDSIWESKFEREMCEEKERRRQVKIERLRMGEMERRNRLRQSSASSVNRQRRDDMKMEDIDIDHPPSADGDITDHHYMDGILKEPLNDTTTPLGASGADANVQQLNSASALPNNADFPEEARNRLDDPFPARKRRRGHVDYKELYEQMKKEGNFVE